MIIAMSRSPLLFAIGVVAGGPIPPREIPFLALLFAMLAAWLVLVSWLFSRLRDRHAPTYEAMGSPSLFRNNSARCNWLFLRFLCSSDWRDLGDPAASKVIHSLRILLVVYPILFLACAAILFLG